MDSDAGEVEGAVPDKADLVVVDRGALRELLTAVINTLQASESLESMPPAEGDSGDFAEVRRQIASARSGLVSGIERIVAAVDELPSAVVQKDERER
jgi:hypothetical protein